VRTQSQIEVDVQNALIATAQSKAQVAAARETVNLEQQKLDAEQLRFQAGVSTSYNVVLVQRDLFAAQLAEVQALDAYAKARVTMDQAVDLTLDHNRVDLDDALRGRLRLLVPTSWRGLMAASSARRCQMITANTSGTKKPWLISGSFFHCRTRCAQTGV
jgi:hypothetical protein